MRLAFFTIICVLLISNGGFSQVVKPPVASKTSVGNPTPKTSTPFEIPEKEWNSILNSLEVENWTLAGSLISQSFIKLKVENKKDQLARLRYFYLYALAGKVSKGKMSYDELEKVTDGFLGKDFLMPPRKVLAECKNSLNYICQLKNYSQTLRFTASNKAFDAIHSFEYVMIPETFDVVKFDGVDVILGGKLKKVEFNPKRDTSWIMRLYFENGTIQGVEK